MQRAIAGYHRDEDREPRKDGHPPQRPDLVGAVLVTATPSLAVYTIVSGSQNGWTAPGTLTTAGLAVATAVVFVVVESRLRAPLVPLRIFRSRLRIGANLARLLFPVGMFGTFFLASLFLEQVLGYGAVETGLAFLPANLLMALFSLFLTKRLMARWGAQAMVVTGLLLLIASLSLLARVPQNTSYALGILPPMILLGMGAGLFFMPSVSLAMSNTDSENSGLASGLANVTLQLGAALGVAVVAGVSSSATSRLLTGGSGERAALTGGYHMGFMVAAAVVVLAVVVAATSPRALSMWSSRSTCAWVASPTTVSQPLSEYRASLAWSLSTITKGNGLRASSRATLRPTRPAPQMM